MPVRQSLHQQNIDSAGFTLIEMIVVLGVLGTLLAFSVTNLVGLQNRTRLATTMTTLISDIQLQRLKAMDGDTEGRGTIDSYGIYFGTSQYVLFHGSTYNASATDNVIVAYDLPVSLSSTTFAGSQIVFTKGSGEIASYVSNQNTVTFVNPADNATKQLVFNRFGAIVSGAL
jgi:prepilin-type N-terminal cleavage/methylation domain-containing protein